MTITISQLKKVLATFGVDVKKWDGKDGNKTIYQLAKEINSKESNLTINENGLVRYMRRVEMIICRPSMDKALIEYQQIMKDGSKVKLDRVPAEKMVGNESPSKALRRGLMEELGLDKDDYHYRFVKKVRQTRMSKRHPDLVTTEDVFFFKVVLRHSTVLSLKHKDHDGKTIEFRWVNMDQIPP